MPSTPSAAMRQANTAFMISSHGPARGRSSPLSHTPRRQCRSMASARSGRVEELRAGPRCKRAACSPHEREAKCGDEVPRISLALIRATGLCTPSRHSYNRVNARVLIAPRMPKDGDPMRRFVFAFCLALAAADAAAQSQFPAKPIRIVVPYAPGGLTDVVARLFAEQLRKVLSGAVFVENKPGASGILAIEE